MSAKAGDKALSGEWEEIGGHKFEITEEMTMTFEGRSCNILDGEEKVVDELGTKDGQVTREVLAGYRCYVMRARIKFEKR